MVKKRKNKSVSDTGDDKKLSPNEEAVHNLIEETLLPEVYDLWLDNKMSLLSATLLSLSVKLDAYIRLDVEDEPGQDEREDTEQ